MWVEIQNWRTNDLERQFLAFLDQNCSNFTQKLRVKIVFCSDFELFGVTQGNNFE